MLGWVHDRGATFPPVGPPSPVVKRPFISQVPLAYRRLNPNLKPWAKEVMKKDNDEIDHGKILQARHPACPGHSQYLPAATLLVLRREASRDDQAGRH
jgi:hypothetical protein